jgi:hypothetical protein
MSNKAWTGLLGMTPEVLAGVTNDELRDTEQRILFSRVTLLFGWIIEEGENGVGRLCIAEVRHF